MLSGFLVLRIHAVCMFIGLPDLLRHFLRLQMGKTVFVSVLNRLFIIPALEAQHVQDTVHSLNLRLHRRLLMEEQLPPLGIGFAALYAPLHELFDVLDLQAGLF